jgi:CheY-like chemotaxis protein
VTANNAFSALIVDDNWFNRDLSRRALKHVGFNVTEANGGREALRLLDSQQFDLMILDLAMPEMDGAQLLRTVRELSAHQKMCVVVMTANPHMVTQEIDTDTDFVMNKPINIAEFAQLAERLKQRWARPA